MTDVAEQVATAIGADRVIAAAERPAAHDEDLGRNPLGTPAAWVRPRSTAEVAEVVRVARDTRTAVVPAHRRTTYWRPLAFTGAIVVDVAALDHVGAVDVSARTLRCGAAASARAIDDALRATGHTLTAWPDAYGDTAIGAMIATAFTSGIGMGLAGADELVTGLTAVIGTGQIVRAGAGEVLGAGGFERPGLPDLAGLLFGSEGGLGIVTEVVVRARPRCHRAKLSFDVPGGLTDCVALAESLRIPGLYETFRCVAHGPGPVDAEITLLSPLSRAELEGRVAFVRRVAGRRVAHLEALFEAPDGDDIPRFCGEADEHWAHLRAGRFCGVDAIVPYGEIAAALSATESVMARARGVSHIDGRRALYFAPDFVNLGLHWMLDADVDQATADRIVEVGVDDLSELSVIPYRWGRVWSPMAGKLDPGYRAAMAAIKRTLDPDNILNPGVSVFGAAG